MRSLHLLSSLISVMIVSWYQFVIFVSDDAAESSTVTSDNEIINELNEELDWWEYQKITWLLIGAYVRVYMHVVCIISLYMCVAHACTLLKASAWKSRGSRIISRKIISLFLFL